MKYLLDTEVLIGGIKGRLPVVLRLAELKPSDVAVSVFSQIEAETALRLAPRAQARFGKLLKEFLASVHVLEFGRGDAQQAVMIGSSLQATGETLAPIDLWLSATALSRQLILVTERANVFASVPNLDVERWH